jgi:hypothetical protein
MPARDVAHACVRSANPRALGYDHRVATDTETDPLAALAQRIDALVDAPGLGWTLAHCAQSIEYSMTGYPKLRSGLFRATIGPLAKRRFLRAGKMSHDITAPVAGAPELAATLDFAAARARLRAAITAFRELAGDPAPHLAYGPCTKDEYARLHLLHVEDHLRARDRR